MSHVRDKDRAPDKKLSSKTAYIYNKTLALSRAREREVNLIRSCTEKHRTRARVLSQREYKIGFISLFVYGSGESERERGQPSKTHSSAERKRARAVCRKSRVSSSVSPPVVPI